MSLDNVVLHLVNTLDDVLAYRTWLGERRPSNVLGLDSETSGLDKRRDALRLVQVGDGTHGWAIPWERWGGVFADTVRLWTGDWVLHNRSFDLAFFDRYGVELPRRRCHDTMVMARVNEPNYPMGLKSQTARHVDAAAGGLQQELGNTEWTWATVPIDYDPYWQYAALDPVLTYHLFEHHHPIVAREAPKAYDLELATLEVTERMERYGAHVDRAFARAKYDEFTDYCVRVEEWCRREYNVKPGSNAAIIAILEASGFTFDKATASGAKALDADVLGGVDHPLARAVLQRRRLQKMASTYLRFYVNEADEHDLLHPSINTLGARTSRMSMHSPNLQNLPRVGTSGAGDVVRDCITTRYVHGGTLLMCDFDQIEARLLAHCAREPAMIAAFGGADDFFTTLARQIFQDDGIVKKDKRRQVTKNATYATLYGAGLRKFALTAGITEDQARDFMGRWNTLYPGVRTFQSEVYRVASQRRAETGEAFVRSPFTNRRYVAESGKEYALVNYLIQGGAAEIMKLKLVELDAAGLGEWMVVPVHDEIIADVPAEHVREAAQIMHRVMNDDSLLSVPVTASVSRGERWGSKVDWSPNDFE